MKRNLLILLTFISIITMFISCNKTKTEPEDTGFLYGAYVVNEGSFNNNNGSISYIDLDSSYIINNIFSSVNRRELGDIVQSFCVAGDKGLIVVNHSAKVEVVDMKTFVSLGTITGCDYPRYALGAGNNEVFLTNGSFAGKVYVLDLSSLSITDSITVGYGPETMVLTSDNLYVANSGGWSHDSTVSVIDLITRKVVKNIITGDNPVDMDKDANGDIWVLCKGNVVYDQNWVPLSETDSKLEKISTNSQEVAKSFIIGQKGDYFNPIRLAIGDHGRTLYFVEHDGIYNMSIDAQDVPATPLIPGKFYGLDIDPATGILYALDAKGFSSSGLLMRYTPDGSLMDSVQTGIAPNGVYFNEQ